MDIQVVYWLRLRVEERSWETKTMLALGFGAANVTTAQALVLLSQTAQSMNFLILVAAVSIPVGLLAGVLARTNLLPSISFRKLYSWLRNEPCETHQERALIFLDSEKGKLIGAQDEQNSIVKMYRIGDEENAIAGVYQWGSAKYGGIIVTRTSLFRDVPDDLPYPHCFNNAVIVNTESGWVYEFYPFSVEVLRKVQEERMGAIYAEHFPEKE